jgi:hypothetical protein
MIKKKGTCGCGRSPTGNCIGWHKLTEEEYKKSFEHYKTNRECIHYPTHLKKEHTEKKENK